MENKLTPFFFSERLVFPELCPLLTVFSAFVWNLENKISGELIELGS